MGHRKADLCKPEPSFALFLFSQWENSSLATSGTGHQAEKQELGMDGQVFCPTALHTPVPQSLQGKIGLCRDERGTQGSRSQSDFFSDTSDFHFIVFNCGLFRVLEIRQSFLTF